MIKRALVITLLLFVSTLFAEKAVHITVKTDTYRGRYAPKHCFAAWITDSEDNFIKTIEINGRYYYYRNMLCQWIEHSDWDSTDAVTSASLRSHKTHSLKWDCTDLYGAEVPDGTYKVWVEQTENNNMFAGYEPTASFEIELGRGNSRTQFPSVKHNGYTVFSDIDVTYDSGTPTAQTIIGKNTGAATIIKSGNSQILTVPKGWHNSNVSITNLQGKEVYVGFVQGNNLTLPALSTGIYLMKLSGSQGTYSFKVGL